MDRAFDVKYFLCLTVCWLELLTVHWIWALGVYIFALLPVLEKKFILSLWNIVLTVDFLEMLFIKLRNSRFLFFWEYLSWRLVEFCLILFFSSVDRIVHSTAMQFLHELPRAGVDSTGLGHSAQPRCPCFRWQIHSQVSQVTWISGQLAMNLGVPTITSDLVIH